MAQSVRFSAAVAVAVAVLASATSAGCTSQSVCASARATAAAVESTADAAADAFCGSDDAATVHDPAPNGNGTETLDAASTDGSTISAADTDGSNEQVPLPEAKEEKAEGQLQESGAFNSVSN